MIVNKETIEKELLRHSPLPIDFVWSEQGERGMALCVRVLIGTQAGTPQVIIAFPPKMPVTYLPRALARAKQLIDEIFDANMVGIRFEGGNKQVKPQLILPSSIIVGRPS